MQTPDENSEITYKKPGFTDLTKVVWLASGASSNQIAMVEEAAKLKGYVDQQLSLHKNNPAPAEFKDISFYAQFATVLFQYGGDYKQAADLAIKLTELAEKNQAVNSHFVMDNNIAGIAHAGAFSAAITYHEEKYKKPDNAYLAQAERMHELARTTFKTLMASDSRKAALEGTLAFIRYSQGDKQAAEHILRSSEMTLSGQMKKEDSNNWPVSINKANDFSDWNEIVFAVSPTLKARKNRM